MLNKIIFAFNIIAKDDIDLEKVFEDELKEGLALFNELF